MDGSVSALYPKNRSADDLLSEGWARLPGAYRIPPQTPDIAEARAYCARLARGHYENFSVASWFLPKRLHQHFFNVYAYCRISDDLGDEVGDTQLALALLDRWEEELRAMYRRLCDPPQQRQERPSPGAPATLNMTLRGS